MTGMTNLIGQERRITLRLLAYWNEIRGDRPFPSENDIDPDRLEDVWDYCFLVQVRDLKNTQDYNYTYLGSAIVQAYKGALAEDACAAIVSPNASSLNAAFQRVLSTHAPVIEEAEFNNLRGQVIKFRQILLPLAHGTHIDAIFGGMRFKVFG